MKRVLSILVAALMALVVFAGCSGGGTPADTPTDAASVKPSESVASTAPAETSGEVSEGTSDPATYNYPEFYNQPAGEYFKGLLMKEDFQSRADIVKGLPAAGTTKKDLTIGFAANTMDNAYFVLLGQACETEAKKYGYTLNVVCYNGDVSMMGSVVEDFITQQVDAIIIDPFDMNAAAVACEKAAAAGIPCIAVGQPMPADSAVVTSIHPNFYELAYTNAYNMVKDCFSKDTKMVVGSIMGTANWHTWSLAYLTGAYAARMEQMGTPLSKYDAMVKGAEYYKKLFADGSIDIPEANMSVPAYIAEGGWAQEGGMAACESLLSAVPDMNCIFCINDFNALGAIMALENNGKVAGKDVILVAACDGSTEAVEAVRDGKLYASANNCPEWQAAAAVKLINKIFEGGFDANNLTAHTLVPLDAITKDNWKDHFIEGSIYSPSPTVEPEFKTPDQCFQEFLAAQEAK